MGVTGFDAFVFITPEAGEAASGQCDLLTKRSAVVGLTRDASFSLVKHNIGKPRHRLTWIYPAALTATARRLMRRRFYRRSAMRKLERKIGPLRLEAHTGPEQASYHAPNPRELAAELVATTAKATSVPSPASLLSKVLSTTVDARAVLK